MRFQELKQSIGEAEGNEGMQVFTVELQKVVLKKDYISAVVVLDDGWCF